MGSWESQVKCAVNRGRIEIDACLRWDFEDDFALGICIKSQQVQCTGLSLMKDVPAILLRALRDACLTHC
jgi:hypothetical protein